jgi:hypothetical protein
MLPAAVLLAIITHHPAMRAEQLLAQLGGPRYVVREHAGRELVKLGRPALPVLRRGECHLDLEVAERCKRLVPLAEVEAVRQRVAILLETSLKPVPAEVPLARRFLAVAGDTREARQLYADVYVAHAQILERIHIARTVANEAFRWPGGTLTLRSHEFFSALSPDRPPAPLPVAPRADLALFWFLSADPGIRLADQRPPIGGAYTRFFDGATVRDAAAEMKASPALRTLFLAWLAGPRSFEDPFAEVTSVRAGFRLAAELGLPEVRDLALSVALDREQWTCRRAAALLALARVGRAEDAPRLSSLVGDDTMAAAGYVPGTPGVTVLLGDIALGACVNLTGAKPRDFGFPNAGLAADEPADLFLFGFPPDGAARAAARKRWADSTAAQTLVTGGKP